MRRCPSVFLRVQRSISRMDPNDVETFNRLAIKTRAEGSTGRGNAIAFPSGILIPPRGFEAGRRRNSPSLSRVIDESAFFVRPFFSPPFFFFFYLIATILRLLLEKKNLFSEESRGKILVSRERKLKLLSKVSRWEKCISTRKSSCGSTLVRTNRHYEIIFRSTEKQEVITVARTRLLRELLVSTWSHDRSIDP